MSVTAKPLINAHFASSSDTLEYSTPSGTRTIIDKFTATNTDAAARTLSVNIVPSGGTANASNLIMKAVSIAAGVTYNSADLSHHVLNPGDFISVVASAASVVSIRASGREVV